MQVRESLDDEYGMEQAFGNSSFKFWIRSQFDRLPVDRIGPEEEQVDNRAEFEQIAKPELFRQHRNDPVHDDFPDQELILNRIRQQLIPYGQLLRRSSLRISSTCPEETAARKVESVGL